MERIGRYELLREIGHGGMGKVYLARDSSEMGRKMQRQVAIKVMLERQTHADMRDRFFREAQAAGNLSHPNIVTIHDLAIDDDTPYIVMEYLEGVSLAERLVHDRICDLMDRLSALCGEEVPAGNFSSTVRMPAPEEGEHLASELEEVAHDLPGLRPSVDAALGRLRDSAAALRQSPLQRRAALDLLEAARDLLWPVATRPEDDRAMTIAERLGVGKQIADGLAFAHRKGVVHRDIKPGNIQLVNGFHILDGLHVKILDFGIAQLDSQQSRTKGAPPGTPRYMSPEQYQGDRAELNHRTDIWSLGVMLYELLAGRHAFEGDTFAALSYRVVHEPHAPLSKVNPAVPESVSQVVSRALAKQPADRFQDATALSRALQACIEEIAQTAGGPEDEIRRDIEKYITFARNLVRQRKFDQADREARRAKALEESEHSRDSHPGTASRADEVISEIGAARARAAQKRRGRALIDEVREHLARDQVSSARDLVAQAAEAAPDSVSVQAACTELGNQIARLERAQAVATDLRAAREALEQRRVDVADAHVRAALETHPAHEGAMELAAAIRRARELDVRVAAARLSFDDGDLQAAENNLTTVLNRDPGHPAASDVLEKVQEAMRAAEAWDQRRRLLNLGPPEFPDALLEAARDAFEAGRFGEAESHLLESLALDDNHEPTLTLLAEVRTEMERTERERVLAARVAAAQKAFDDGDPERAELDLEVALALDEAHEGALALSARVQEALAAQQAEEEARLRARQDEQHGDRDGGTTYIQGERRGEPPGVGDPTADHPRGGLFERVNALPRHHPLAAGSAVLTVIAVLVWFVGAVDAPAPADPNDRSGIVALPTEAQENRPPDPDDRSADTIAATAGLSDATPAESATPSEDAAVESEPAAEATEAPESPAEPAPGSNAPADPQLDAPESTTETLEPSASVDTPPTEPVRTAPPDASPTPEQAPASAEPTTPAAPPQPRAPMRGGLRGTVREGSAGVAGVTVRLVGHNSEGVFETTTSDGGVYEFPPIPPDEYTVLFIRDGETVHERSALSIGEGRFLTLGVRLESAEPPC